MERTIAVVIHYIETSDNLKTVQSLKYGIEEEGLPSIVQSINQGNLLELASSASMASDLDVGIGLDAKGGIATHQAKLPDGMLLFEGLAEHVDLRKYGANAARLIKGIPLKEY